jgi:hypothetical protein
MAASFQSLLKFLERFDDEVQGRESPEPTGAEKMKLQLLARGTLPAREHAEAFALLDKNPEWIGWLAREIKSLRRGNA